MILSLNQLMRHFHQINNLPMLGAHQVIHSISVKISNYNIYQIFSAK